MKEPFSGDKFPQIFAGLTVFSVSLVVSSLIAATAIGNFQRSRDVLVVTGSAKRPITSDYIIWSFSVSSQQPTVQAAYEDLQVQTDRVKQYLKEQQVPDNMINLKAIDNAPIREISANGQETGQTLAYRLSQRWEIRSDEVDFYSKLAQQSTALIKEGISLVSDPPQYLYTKLSQVRIEMVAEAAKDAKARAEAIANSTGNQVGTVQSAETGVFQITSRHSTEVSDYGISDTTSLEKDITAVVSVKFNLQ